jgi:hypothetical protein
MNKYAQRTVFFGVRWHVSCKEHFRSKSPQQAEPGSKRE